MTLTALPARKRARPIPISARNRKHDKFLSGLRLSKNYPSRTLYITNIKRGFEESPEIMSLFQGNFGNPIGGVVKLYDCTAIVNYFSVQSAILAMEDADCKTIHGQTIKLFFRQNIYSALYDESDYCTIHVTSRRR